MGLNQTKPIRLPLSVIGALAVFLTVYYFYFTKPATQTTASQGGDNL